MQPIVATFVLALGAWTAQFNEDAQTLALSHADANVQIAGTLAFEVDGQPWRVGTPRDLHHCLMESSSKYSSQNASTNSITCLCPSVSSITVLLGLPRPSPAAACN